MASVGKLKWNKVPHYLAAQFIGAFFGALIVFFNYSNAILNRFGGFNVTGDMASADIFGTYPNPESTIFLAFFEQVSFLTTFCCWFIYNNFIKKL